MAWDDDGSLLLTVRVSSVHAPEVLARIEQAQQVDQSDRDALYARLARDLSTEGAPEQPPRYPRERH